MWLLTAVGPVHGQSKFTFALEQKREYTVGRDGSCNIRFESRHVRPKEGTLIVDDWDPRQPRTSPSLRWRTEPKKNGTFGTYKTLGLHDLDDAGSTDLDDYQLTEMKEGEGGHGCFLEKGTEGILFSDDNWFTTEWKDLSLQYDKMKDESDDVRDLLRRYCISWTQTFDTVNRPDYVISASLRSNVDCNYAVCYGIRILLPLFLEALIARLKVCWKAVADSQDSFTLPDEEDRQYQPEIDASVPAARKELRTWLPDPRREALYGGWKILGLRGKTQPAEKRYLIAMGADYQDIDVLTKPVSSKEDFLARIDPWLKYCDGNGGRDRAMVVWFVPVKVELTKKGLNWAQSISNSCHESGVYLAHGGVLWGSVSYDSPLAYCTALASNIGRGETAAGPSKSAAPSNDFAVPDLPLQARSTQGPAAASQSTQQPRADFVPSSFPEETTRTTGARSPSPSAAPSRPVRRARQNTSPLKDKSPDLFPETASVPAPASKKPLKRRAKNGAVDLSRIQEDLPLSRDDTPERSDGSQPQPDFVQDSQPEETQRPLFLSQRMDIDSIAPSQPATQASVRRLKRRAGGATPSLIQEIADTSIDVERDLKAEETAAEIRELYRQTGTSSFDPRAIKRSRIASGTSGANAELAESSFGKTFSRSRRTQTQTQEKGDGSMDVDSGGSALLSSGRLGRTRETQEPPAGQRSRDRSPSEEQEELESHPPTKFSRTGIQTKTETISPIKYQAMKNQAEPSKDETFLQAINKASNAKKAIDELDREFNQLRIPKPNGKTAVVKANEWEANRPDWKILDDFDDDLRGNFIQIVRKDLFRKDQPHDKEQIDRVDDGRPNFKKFKKKNIVRREPLGMVLTGPTAQDAEMGEPYWPTQAVKGKRTQSQAAQELEDDMPLLPQSRSRKRLLGTQAMTQDDDGPTQSQRRSRVPETQQTQTPAASQVQPATKGRKAKGGRATRGVSVASEADSIGTTMSASTTATGTASRSRRTANTTDDTASKSTSRTRGKKEPIVLEDSDEEQEQAIDWGVVGDSTNSASAKLRSGKTAPASGKGTRTVTLDNDPPLPSSTSRGRRQPAAASASAGTSTQTGRRKLLPADDEDGMGFRGMGKKRRLG